MRIRGASSNPVQPPVQSGRRARSVRRSTLATSCAPFIWLTLALPTANAQTSASFGNTAKFEELVQSYCVDCHNFEDWAGGVAMDALDLGRIGHDAEVWESAVNKLRGRLMPPAGEAQPDQAIVDEFVGYLETSIDADAANRPIGHVPIQRLNRTEFAESVKGLLGVEVDPVQVLPTEIEVEGFDNIAGALVTSPAFLEQYISAARLVARLAVGEPQPKFASTYYPSDGGTQRSPAANQTTHRDGFPLGTRGGMSFKHVFPADGEYRFNVLDVDAGLYPRGVETAATLVLLIDGVEVARKEIGGPADLELADRDGPEGREAIVAKLAGIPAQVKAGSHEVMATFIERSWAMSNNASGNGRVYGMPRIQDGVEVEGPFDPRGLSLSDSREKIFICTPKRRSQERACAERIARHLATRAFRRPVSDDDMKWLMPFFEGGRTDEGGFDAGVTELVTAILSSPDFLYRTIRTAPDSGHARELNGLELASRLSFFLWSQGPDEELIKLATAGLLADSKVLEQQVTRMMADDRAQALVENFALAWLNVDELHEIQPQDPTFNDAILQAFDTEIHLFVSSVLLGGGSVRDLLDADYTFVNEALAQRYGIPGVRGPQFRKVTLTDDYRRGLLGKGAVLLRTSYGDRTSPVLRGAWVLERLMGTPPAPPPPNVDTDISIREGEKPTTVRARLEKHRDNPNCQGCHGVIDPPGLALENFDNTGRWRLVDDLAKAPIDARTTMSSGVQIDGPVQLREFILGHKDQFPTTVTKRLMMYALNREIEYFDMPLVRQIVRKSAGENYSFASIVTGIVTSDAFRRQGPEEEKEVSVTATADAGK
ncbi:MAG: DUF1592 domain-containing protein [Gammaproteobacteria bacterium]|nr:DUF1592 domain-containing protein [Gammaproteobacteria bacterium]